MLYVRGKLLVQSIQVERADGDMSIENSMFAPWLATRHSEHSNLIKFDDIPLRTVLEFYVYVNVVVDMVCEVEAGPLHQGLYLTDVVLNFSG